MSWTAIVPARIGGARKSRLSGVLSADQRERLAERMFDHVLKVLNAHERIGECIVLSPAAPIDAQQRWSEDKGRGLNPELTELRSGLARHDVVILHADLPFLSAGDVTDLLEAADEAGIAIAPDRLGTGTNGVALKAGQPFRFAFGVGSCAAHRKAAGPQARLVERHGLGFDIDSPEDLDLARAAGFNV